MIDRMQLGSVPAKPHTVHRHDGELVFEHCFTRDGFDGAYSILYHKNHPSRTTGWGPSTRGWAAPVAVAPDVLQRRLFTSPKLPVGGQMLDCRKVLFFSADVQVSIARPDTDDDAWFSNADGDELHFIHEGAGVIETAYGLLAFEAGDYVGLPRGTMHRWTWRAPGYVFTTEATGWLGVPSQFRNATGQLKMDAPYTHRDFGRPAWPEGGMLSHTKDGARVLVTKRGDRFHAYEYAHSPLDVVGWDGFVWPFTFAITKYQAKTGLVHLPPTIHATFAGKGFVLCSFVPRVTDFHPEAIPCPYPHSSFDCDEIIFYVRGNFTSRKGVGPGALSLHPAGVIHGPHPGSYEKSIGSVRTDELAVMLDTARPLQWTAAAAGIEDPGYMRSWVP